MKTKNKALAIMALATMAVMPASYVSADEAVDATAIEATAVQVKNTFKFDTPATVGEVTSDSVSLTWDAIEGAEGYVVLYDTYSVANSEDESAFYSNETEDLLLENNAVVSGLNPNATYYFTVTAIDANGIETPNAPEVSATTLESDVDLDSATEVKAEGLVVESSAITSSKTIELTFNSALDDSESAIREFAVVDTEANEFFVEKAELKEEKTLILTVDNEMKAGADYSVTVIALQDKEGNNVEAGVDGLITITAPAEFATEEVAPVEVVEKEVVVEPVVETTVEPTVDPVTDAKKLPDTGAEEMVLVLAALLMAGFITLRKRA